MKKLVIIMATLIMSMAMLIGCTGSTEDADAIMALVGDLIVKYSNENPEYIKSAVIGANIDYITEEDLSTILTAYGYIYWKS